MLGLDGCGGFSLAVMSSGHRLAAACGCLLAAAFLVAEHGRGGPGLQSSQPPGSRALGHRLSGCGGLSFLWPVGSSWVGDGTSVS